MTETCAACGKPIDKSKGGMVSTGKEFYHKECFVCGGCGKPIDGPFGKSPEDGKLRCKACIPKTMCEKCGMVINVSKEKALKVNGKSFHVDCFKCAKCDESLTSGYFEVDGQMVCKKCAESGKDAGGKTVKARASCVVCEKPITGEYVTGHLDDKMHEECFTCARCNKNLSNIDFAVNEDRKFKYQKARYTCIPCRDLEKEKKEATKLKPCAICGKDCYPGPEIFTLIDGDVVHWDCFRCCDCGAKREKEDIDMTLFRTMVGALKKKKYFCEKCAPKHQAEVKDAKVTLEKVGEVVPRGNYVGRGKKKSAQVSYQIKLMEEKEMWVDFSAVDAIANEKWHVEGQYKEEHEGGHWTLSFKVMRRPFGTGPAPGTEYKIPVIKDPTNDSLTLVIDEINCGSMVGAPEIDASMMHKVQSAKPTVTPVPRAPEAKPAQKPSNDINAGGKGIQERTQVDTTSHSPVKVNTNVEKAPAAGNLPAEEEALLLMLKDASQWKEKGIDPSKREDYLPDPIFLKVFGMDKETFNKQAKWKKDKQKKEHGLF